MALQPRKSKALFFVEGQTECEFYKMVFIENLRGLPKSIYNLNGNGNIHRNVYRHTLDFLRNKPEFDLRIFCCIDRESRFTAPPLDIQEMRRHFATERKYQGRILSADQIVATTMLESWFFYDTEGIFKYLRTPGRERNVKKYQPPERQTWRELDVLFKKHKKS